MIVVWLIVLLRLHAAVGDIWNYTDQAHCNNGDCGRHLFLSPFLDSGRIEEGRRAAKVTDVLPGISSYSGYFTVNETLGSNMFFWFFPAETKNGDAPVVLWLSSPGDAFIHTLFNFNGPYVIIDGPQLVPNLIYWSQSMNVLFIDNPVGTGYSFSKPTNVTMSPEMFTRDLFSAVKQFFQLFSEYQKNDFFIIGESYGGKFAIALAHVIHKQNLRSRSKINLKGLGIGSGWIDPINQIDYSQYLYYLGLIDSKTKHEFANTESQIKSLIKKEVYDVALNKFEEYFLGFEQPSRAQNITGFKLWNNYLENDGPKLLINDVIDNFMNNATWRKNMHVGDVMFDSNAVGLLGGLRKELFTSMAPKLEMLMDHYRVVLFNGELDVMCAYPLAVNYMRKLKWTGAEEYKKAQRIQWRVLDNLAGYAKTAGNFTEILILDVGHKVLQDRLSAMDLMMKFTKNISFDALDD